MVLIDGGVFANNPAACSYASSRKLFSNDDVVLLSIGTGRSSHSIKYLRSKRFGKISWIKPLINVMFASGLDCVNYQLDQIINNSYIRIQSHLKVASTEMDNTTYENVKCLKKKHK